MFYTWCHKDFYTLCMFSLQSKKFLKRVMNLIVYGTIANNHDNNQPHTERNSLSGILIPAYHRLPGPTLTSVTTWKHWLMTDCWWLQLQRFSSKQWVVINMIVCWYYRAETYMYLVLCLSCSSYKESARSKSIPIWPVPLTFWHLLMLPWHMNSCWEHSYWHIYLQCWV